MITYKNEKIFIYKTIDILNKYGMIVFVVSSLSLLKIKKSFLKDVDKAC